MPEVSPDHPVDIPEQDCWKEAQKFWEKEAQENPKMRQGLDLLRKYKMTLEKPSEKEKQIPHLLILLAGEKQQAEGFIYPWHQERRVYGSLPHFEEAKQIIEDFVSEHEFFGKFYTAGNPRSPASRDLLYAEGILLHQLKFGKKLSSLAQEFLENYPPQFGKGKTISIFGLSGSGKSAIANVMKDMGRKVVVIDNDTFRFNVFGKTIRDIESAHGADMEEIRNQLINNRLSGAMYMLLQYVTEALKQRGYTVILCSSEPNPDADEILYIEHPDGIDPRNIMEGEEEEQIPLLAETLFKRTQQRIRKNEDGTIPPDTFDWEHAERILDLNAMKDVTVQVPKRAHEYFLREAKKCLSSLADKIEVIKNPELKGAQARRHNFQQQIEAFHIF